MKCRSHPAHAECRVRACDRHADREWSPSAKIIYMRKKSPGTETVRVQSSAEEVSDNPVGDEGGAVESDEGAMDSASL